MKPFHLVAGVHASSTATFSVAISRRRKAGFTLIEVLVALSLLAVMAVLSWRGIDGITRAQAATQRYTDEVLTLQAGLGQWRADLDAMMVWPTPAGADAARLPPQHSLVWNGSLLRITRQDSGEPGAGLRVVAWARREVDGRWLRWQSQPVRSHAAWDAAWQAAEGWGRAPVPVAAGGAQAVEVATLQDWQLFYYRNNAWSHPLSSAAEGAQNTQALPDAVRLNLTLAPGQSLSGPVVLDWVQPGYGGGT